MYSDEKKELGLTLLVLDVLCMIVSYIVGVVFWRVVIQKDQLIDPDVQNQFWYGLLVFLLAYIMMALFSSEQKGFLKRGVLDTLFHAVEKNFFVLLLVTLFLYILKGGEQLSRGVVGVTIIINVILTPVVHIIYRKYMLGRLSTKKVSQMLVVTSSERLEMVLKQMTSEPEWGRRIAGLCILDDERQGEEIDGIPVVANYYDVIDYIKGGVVDEVFMHVSYTDGKYVKEFITKVEEMGITVYLNINVLDGYDNIGNTITNVHGIPVMTFATKSFTWNQLFLKRVIDIMGGLVGLVITAVVTPFVAVPLLLESPGPLFFRQKRVGRNGRYFKIIKFRSMYMDAEERKKELMAQNEMSGAMFKMTNDPRVTKVGKFIRATSIDELPQFWNVLMGDMSLVGTRPPTVDEFKEYSTYHKRRLSLKPGLTGMWQVSGRSNIENFEEVVRLDLEYIDNWSIALDIKILLKTIVVVFAKVGSK
jgi:exopolysaccharide biosynthesis polyprenyl glycosylphosphotransferase